MPFQSSARGKYGAQSMKPTKGPLAPVWSTSGTIGNNIAQGSAYSFQVTATDDSTETPTYSFGTGSLPTGLSVSSSGLISGTPTVAGTFNFTVNAIDGNGRTTASPTLTISVQNPLKTPQIWYKNSRVGQNPITNDGTLGASYNSPAYPSTTTDSGRNVWNMGTSYFEFPNINLIPTSNSYSSWTIAAVFRTSSSNQKWSLLGSPVGSSQILGSAPRLDSNVELSWNNDGYPFPGSTTMGNMNHASNMCQLVVNYDGITYNGTGRLRMWGPSRTSGTIYDNYLSNTAGGWNYASAIDITRVGWSRGLQDTTWYLAEYMLYTGVVTDSEITQIRTYLGSTHPVGVVNN